ncbi:CDPK-related protein kinase [Nymphaea thermarum]|nr:CDPK-related protein kinase [Nymphaea thermarum]
MEALDGWEQHAFQAYESFEKDGNRAIIIEELASGHGPDGPPPSATALGTAMENLVSWDLSGCSMEYLRISYRRSLPPKSIPVPTFIGIAFVHGLTTQVLTAIALAHTLSTPKRLTALGIISGSGTATLMPTELSSTVTCPLGKDMGAGVDTAHAVSGMAYNCLSGLAITLHQCQPKSQLHALAVSTGQGQNTFPNATKYGRRGERLVLSTSWNMFTHILKSQMSFAYSISYKKETADIVRQYLWQFEENNVMEFLVLAGRITNGL